MKRKYLALGLSFLAVASLTVVGTMAYLSDTTEKVSNTFTFNDDEDGIHLDLIETVFGEDYDEDGLNEDETNLDAVVDMVPGDLVAKNPTIKAEGAECYLFVDVIVANNTANSGVPFYTYSIDTGVTGYTWVLVDGLPDTTAGCTTDGTATYVLSDAHGPVIADGTHDFAILKDEKADKLGDYDGTGTTPTEVVGSVQINTALTQEDLLAVEAGEDETPSLSFISYAVQAANVESDAVEALFISEFK